VSYRTEAVKRYCLLYQQCEDKPSILVDDALSEPQEILKCELFGKILERVSNLLLYVIYRHTAVKRHLGRIELNDLYHTAIVGLGNAANTVKEEETSDRVIQRIAAYVKAEIDKTYPLTKTRRDFAFQRLEVTTERYVLKDRDIQGVEEIELAVELRFLRDEYVSVLAKGVISETDFVMLVRRYAMGATFTEMSNYFDIPVTTVKRFVHSSRNILQHYFRAKNWEV
jgi:hypothetical protein